MWRTNEVEYPTYLSVKATTNLNLRKEPYEDSGNVQQIKKNSVQTAVALVQNKYGNYWYKLDLGNGQFGYAFAKYLSVTGAKRDKVVFPDQLLASQLLTYGEDQNKNLKNGVIKTQYTDISTAQFMLKNTSGTSLQMISPLDGSGKSFSVTQGGVVDQNLHFDKLPHALTYLEVIVKTKNYYSDDGINRKSGYEQSYAKSYNFNIRYWRTVRFDSNGGSAFSETVKGLETDSVTLPKTVPTRSGYTFLGWATRKDAATFAYKAGESFKIPGVTDLNNPDIVLYAVWQKNTGSGTLSYNANGGIGAPASQKAVIGATLKLSSTKPTRSGYTFLGWAASKSATKAEYAAGASYTLKGNTTLYAVWQANTYTLSYNANGGTAAPASAKCQESSSVTLSKTLPTRTGYTFLGWSESKTAATAAYKSGSIFKMPAKNVTLYAVWKANTYKVTYNLNAPDGAGLPAAQEGDYDSNITLSRTILARAGYEFLGWSENRGATTPSYKPGATFEIPARDVTLYAVWKGNTYTIKYDANGGSGAPASQSGTCDSVVRLSNVVPVRPNYIFKGWSENKNGSADVYLAGAGFTVPAKNVTLYAVWKEDLYTITYDGNGGSGVPGTQSSAPNVSVTISETTPTRTGYTFLGWSESKTATAATYKAKDAFKMPAKNITLYAVWQVKTYTVTYDANYGSGAPSTQSGSYDSTIKLSSVIPSRTGYDFLGWATSKNASKAEYAPGASYTLKNNVTFYAVWKVKTYTVTYDANYGSGAPSAQSGSYDSTIKLSSVIPSRTGYDFLGWATSKNASKAEYAPGTSYTLKNNVTLYAVWQAKTYTISYDANYGTGAPAAQSGSYDSTIKLSSVIPSRTGYDFLGWATSKNAAEAEYAPGASYTVKGEVTFYAVWKIRTYTITYDANGGNSEPAAQTGHAGQTLTLQKTQPWRTDYEFLGWAETKDGPVKWHPGDRYTLSDNMILYAAWQKLEDIPPEDDINWSINDDGVLTISGTGAIPNYQEGNNLGLFAPWHTEKYSSVVIESGITRIGRDAFMDGGMTAVSIPDTVTSIGDGAFYNCGKLSSIQIPDSVTTIEVNAFMYCDSLTSVSLPASVFEIGGTAFSRCPALKTIDVADGNPYFTSADGVLFNAGKTKLLTYPGGRTESYSVPGGVTSISDNAFYGASLSGVILPESLAEIGSGAFSNSKITGTVTIPAAVTEIGIGAFETCTELKEFMVDSENSYYSSMDGVLFNHDRSLLIQYPGGKAEDYVIPGTVTTIDDRAFKESRLSGITFPDTMTEVPVDLFYCCENLKEITFGNGIKHIAEGAFANCINLAPVIVPANVTEIDLNAFYGNPVSITIYCPDCEFGADRATLGVPGKTVVRGYAGSTTQTYADTYGYTFEALDEVKTMSLEALTQPIMAEPAQVPWSLDENGLLTIAGDWAGLTSPVPWAEQNESITAIILEESVSAVGIDAFAACSALSVVTVQNPNCELGESSATLGNPEMTVIHGYSGSTAETYAEKYGYVFEPMDAEAIEDSTSEEIVKPEDAEVPPDSSEVVDEANETPDLQAEALPSVNTDNPAEFEGEKDEVSGFPSDTPELDAADDIPESSIEAPVTDTQEDEESTITDALQAAIPEEPETGKINDQEANEGDNP